MMDPMLMSAFSGALGGLMTKAFDGPLNSVQDVWFATVGYKTALLRQKAEERNKLQIEAYAKDIASEVAKIPENSIKEPDYSILGPAFEASTYYVNNETVRGMFAKLVASSVDERKDGITRSAFVEFVKQMSIVDANLLKKLANRPSVPMADLGRELPDNKGVTDFKSEILPIDFESNPEIRKLLPSAIINLDRLGLIKSTYTVWKSAFNYEQEFQQTPEYIELKTELDETRKKYTESIKVIKSMHLNVDPNAIPSMELFINSKISVGKGRIFLTNLGKDFISVCL